MTAASLADSKHAMRADMRAARMAFATGRPQIAPPQPFLDQLGSGIIAGYLPMPGEADPAALIAAAAARGYSVALPHVAGRDQAMRFLRWEPGDTLVTNGFGLRQPREDAPAVTPDIVLTPLVAFDATLNRLGQGAGYYDRAFAALPAVLRIGVAWSIQQVDRLPVDAWDVPLHGVVTERGWIAAETTT
jgi:5-formyltetrahydrofolate cyclo-ligase